MKNAKLTMKLLPSGIHFTCENTVNSRYNELWRELTKVRYIGSSLSRELPAHRKTKLYCSYAIGWAADKDDSNFLLSEPTVNVQHL